MGTRRVFWYPVSSVQPTEKGKVNAHRRQSVIKVIRKMRQLTWDDRPFAKGVAAMHGMSWWRKVIGNQCRRQSQRR